jgi:hypothetical protein
MGKLRKNRINSNEVNEVKHAFSRGKDVSRRKFSYLLTHLIYKKAHNGFLRQAIAG